MAEYLANAVQNVALNAPVLFTASIPVLKVTSTMKTKLEFLFSAVSLIIVLQDTRSLTMAI